MDPSWTCESKKRSTWCFTLRPGSSIEKTLMAVKDLLAPGGTLCITMFSPSANFSGSACPVGQHMRHVFEERQGEGKRWPGEGFRLKELLQELKAPATWLMNKWRFGDIWRTDWI